MTSTSVIKLVTQKNKNNSGVGLLGMVYLILFLGMSSTVLLMVLSAPRLSNATSVTAERARQIRNAIKEYIINHGGVTAGPAAYPSAIGGLFTDDLTGACTMDSNPASPTFSTLQGWCGPYLYEFTSLGGKMRKDGWGTDFSYDNATSNITSCGPDRTCANADDITYAP